MKKKSLMEKLGIIGLIAYAALFAIYLHTLLIHIGS